MSGLIDLRESPSGKAIAAYCCDQAQALGLTLGVAGVEARQEEGQEEYYVVHMSIIEPFREGMESPTYTRAQVEGYATGDTKNTIQRDIRALLENAKQDWQMQNP